MLLYAINIAKCFPHMVELCIFPIQISRHHENVVIECSLGKSAELELKKWYRPKTPQQASIIQQVYKKLKIIHEQKIPGAFNIISASLGSQQTVDGSLELSNISPVGFNILPENEKQLIATIKDILHALKALHGHGIYHCDIHWENVIHAYHPDRWVLIDFEDAQVEIGEDISYLKAAPKDKEKAKWSCSRHLHGWEPCFGQASSEVSQQRPWIW
jgi:serine/threonine protein kinase